MKIKRVLISHDFLSGVNEDHEYLLHLALSLYNDNASLYLDITENLDNDRMSSQYTDNDIYTIVNFISSFIESNLSLVNCKAPASLKWETSYKDGTITLILFMTLEGVIDV